MYDVWLRNNTSFTYQDSYFILMYIELESGVPFRVKLLINIKLFIILKGIVFIFNGIKNNWFI